MKVILSRKGCDSSFGGMPGIILPDGRIVFIPIPGMETETIRYGDLMLDQEKGKIVGFMKQVSPFICINRDKFGISREIKCHLDPDLNMEMYPREPEWRGCFGQVGAAQTVLENSNVNNGDVFLFFGWFNHTELKDGKLFFCKGQGFHMIFGWLQIDHRIYTKQDIVPDWLQYHPHARAGSSSAPNNCIYIARKNLSWNGEICGYGIFPNFRKELVLTKNGMTRSKWALPDEFRGLGITYHNETSWKEEYFQSACRGQEFIFEENKAVENWAKKIITYK